MRWLGWAVIKTENTIIHQVGKRFGKVGKNCRPWSVVRTSRPQWKNVGKPKGEGPFTDRKDKAFFVPKAEIADNKYDLSLSRYKEIVHTELKYDPPKKILTRLKKLEAEIASDLEELEALLG